MISNRTLVAFVLFFSILVELIWASTNDDNIDIEDLDDMPSWGKDLTLNISSESFNSESSSRKGLKTAYSRTGVQRRIQKYHKNTLPIDPKITDEEVENLRKHERQLLTKGIRCKWDKFKELKKEEAKDLCLEAWKIQVERIPDLKQNLGDAAAPDCEPSLAAGIGSNRYKKAYKGHFQYLNELKDRVFYPDLIRCQCAYLRYIESRGIYKTVFNSKKFFFLQKDNGTMYFIHTILGETTDNSVKLVDACELIVHKP